jgi:putative phosphoribosyl transferase
LARALRAELDIVLSRKLRAPLQPELAIGAIGEDGAECLNEFAREVPGVTSEYLARERACQLAEIGRRAALFRAVRPAARVAQRSVIVTDDGVATGATMLAALHVLRAGGPLEIVVAVPVAPAELLASLRRACDELVCLLAPEYFRAVGAHYEDFEQVEDAEVVSLLRESAHGRGREGVAAN